MKSADNYFDKHRNRADEIFHVVRVDLDPAIGQESLQAVPVVCDIGKLFSEP